MHLVIYLLTKQFSNFIANDRIIEDNRKGTTEVRISARRAKNSKTRASASNHCFLLRVTDS